MNVHLPAIGMRTIKTAVAVVISFFIFFPFWGNSELHLGTLAIEIGPFYACIAAVICMQSSVEQSVKSGGARMIGTLIGGGVGLLVLTVDAAAGNKILFALLLGLGIILTIWLCNLIQQPASCAIACIVCCCIMLSHSGQERYLFTLARISETFVGILVALAVNHLLLSPKAETKK
jgi:uncharacterized membrane protein YgaE (UPF0421/DUF939 family)